MNNYIIFCTHGGLGNQLFQVLYARLNANKYNIDKIYYSHNKNYKRLADFELTFLNGIKPAKFIDNLILKFRIPKILERLNLSKSGKIIILNKLILDNYFQDSSFYSEFSKNEIITQISILRKEFHSNFNDIYFNNYNQLNIFHFRLGDFFQSDIEQIKFIESNLKNIPNNTVVISNRDDLFSSIRFFSNLDHNNIKYLETKQFTSIQMLFLFTKFNNIFLNFINYKRS